MTNWKEKNVGVLRRKGTSERKPVTDDRDGTVGGYHVEHWDGSQDAVVQPKTIKAALTMKEE